MTADVVLNLQHASAGYDGKAVLVDINLKIFAGECVALMGRSGAGKSTLIGLLYDQCPAHIALVPQAASLVKTLSVFHNVYMGRLDCYSTATNLRNLIWPTRGALADVTRVLIDVDLADKLHATAGSLSGGQQQRTSVARALFNGRQILLGDEPVSALDRVHGAEILSLLRRRHQTLVLALHDIGLALKIADRIIVLEHGRKVIDAPASTLSATDLVEHFDGGPG